jgi:hypothetical protein
MPGQFNQVVNSAAGKNHGDGLDFQAGFGLVTGVVANGNLRDGVFLTCPGDAVRVLAGGNATNLDTTVVSSLRCSETQPPTSQANRNSSNGVFMTCPATQSGVAAKNNGSANLVEDSTKCVCTDLNNQAP